MRRVAETLLLALLLVAVQTALLTHEHGDGQAPAGAAAQSCEYCSSHSAAAPAPDGPSASLPAAPLALPAASERREVFPSRISAAHRSRAPPPIRSI
jgi:hypothetical protein